MTAGRWILIQRLAGDQRGPAQRKRPPPDADPTVHRAGQLAGARVRLVDSTETSGLSQSLVRARGTVPSPIEFKIGAENFGEFFGIANELQTL